MVNNAVTWHLFQDWVYVQKYISVMMVLVLPLVLGSIPSSSSSASFHLHHLLGHPEGELHELEDALARALDGFNASPERQQQYVEPCDKEADPPCEEDQHEEPKDGPQNPRTQLCPSATLSLTHSVGV